MSQNRPLQIINCNVSQIVVARVQLSCSIVIKRNGVSAFRCTLQNDRVRILRRIPVRQAVTPTSSSRNNIERQGNQRNLPIIQPMVFPHTHSPSLSLSLSLSLSPFLCFLPSLVGRPVRSQNILEITIYPVRAREGRFLALDSASRRGNPPVLPRNYSPRERVRRYRVHTRALPRPRVRARAHPHAAAASILARAARLSRRVYRPRAHTRPHRRTPRAAGSPG